MAALVKRVVHNEAIQCVVPGHACMWIAHTVALRIACTQCYMVTCYNFSMLHGLISCKSRITNRDIIVVRCAPCLSGSPLTVATRPTYL